MEPIPPDVSTWFADAAALAAVVAFAVTFIRKHLWKGLDGPLVPAVSALLGVALSYAGTLLGYQPPVHPAVYGLSAGLIASGATDYARTLLKVVGAKEPKKEGGEETKPAGDTRKDADRTRLM